MSTESIETTVSPVAEVPSVAPAAPAAPLTYPEEVKAAEAVIDTVDDIGEPAPRTPAVEADVDSEDIDGHVNEKLAHNALQEFPTTGPKTKGSPDTIAIPPQTNKVITQRMEQAPNIDMLVSMNQQKWAESVTTGMFHTPMEDMYVPRLNEKGADFRQAVNFNNIELRGRTPSMSKKPGQHVAEGELALLQLMTHLGVGGIFRAPMWNSGIWVTFKPATESEMLELNRIIASDKIQAGRWSYGLALSGTVAYTVDRLFDFALGHVYNTSIKSDELPISKLRDHIAPQDINSFIWGFLCSVYPSGFHYTTGCVANPAKCHHVVEENLNVSALQWTDCSGLTDWQKRHMSSPAANSQTLESLKRYKEELKRSQKTAVVLKKGTSHEMRITLKTPTVTEYIDQCHRWIGGLVDSVNAVLGMDASDESRNKEINQLNKATTLCQYGHWIESIEYGEISPRPDEAVENSISIIKDLSSIEKTLKTLSATDSIREEIIDHVLDYINSSTLSVIGVPAYDCPACGKPQDTDKKFPRHVNIIPLDVIQVFLALLSQRVSRIRTRTDR